MSSVKKIRFIEGVHTTNEQVIFTTIVENFLMFPEQYDRFLYEVIWISYDRSKTMISKMTHFGKMTITWVIGVQLELFKMHWKFMRFYWWIFTMQKPIDRGWKGKGIWKISGHKKCCTKIHLKHIAKDLWIASNFSCFKAYVIVDRLQQI